VDFLHKAFRMSVKLQLMAVLRFIKTPVVYLAKELSGTINNDILALLLTF